MRILFAVIGLAIALSCSTFGTADDNATSSGGGTACWPNGSCARGQVCCLDFDGGSRCSDLTACSAEHAHIECRRESDCNAGHCCAGGAGAPPDSGVLYVLTTDCVSHVCAGIATEHRVCATNEECPSPTSCRPIVGSIYPSGNIYDCE